MKPETSIPIRTPAKMAPIQGIALFDRGFRPFFLLAGFAAVLLIGWWQAMLFNINWQPGYFDPLNWHRHEMIFGYTSAVIAGFLLTAVQNWTGVPTAHGSRLLGLVLLWVAGRVVIALPGGLSDELIAIIDISFLPILGLALAFPLWQRRQYRNYIFVPIVLALAIANALMHLQQLQIIDDPRSIGSMLALNIIILLMVIMGGRVIPFFAQSALKEVNTRRWQIIEWASIGAPVVLLVCEPFIPGSPWIALICGIGFIANGIRLLGWKPWKVRTAPLLWVLYLGYAWIVLGFVMKSLAMLEPQWGALAVHAFTLGGIGGLTLGMMARVATGHTGRAMTVNGDMVLAFALIHLGVVCRVLLPMLLPSAYFSLVALSTALWLAAFLIFLWRYIPILIKPRVDGRPG